LAELVAKTRPPCLSAYANVPKRAGEREAQISARHLLERAEAAAARDGLEPARVRAWLSPLTASMEPVPGQARAGRAMALLADERGAQLWPLPFSVAEDAAVGGRDFFLHPLLPLFAAAPFHLLALSRKRARLFVADRYHLRELDAPGLTSERSLDLERHDVQRHAGGEGSIFHARDEVEATERAERARFLRQIGEWVQRHAAPERPLVLAATTALAAEFRDATHVTAALPKVAAGSPDHCTPHELHERVLPIAERHFADERSRRLAAMQAGDAQRYTADPTTVLMAAERGRVETLAVGKGARLRGRFDGHSVVLGDDGEDLLDRALVQTLRHGGSVFPVADGELPTGAACLARLRY